MPKTIHRTGPTLISKVSNCLNYKIENRQGNRKIEIGITKGDIRIEATQLTRKNMKTLL